MLTGIAEGGTTMFTAPDRIWDYLEAGKHKLLLDFGLRLSANFRLYHDWPFTVFAQGFLPVNKLKADNLYAGDYGGPAPDADLDAKVRKAYIDQVKEPRYFVGFELGIF
jgi:hypothetical protein